MCTIVIDPEFQALIPPLQAEERKQLEANIIADGCRDPLVVWRLPKWTPDQWDRELSWDDPDESRWHKEEGKVPWEWRLWLLRY